MPGVWLCLRREVHGRATGSGGAGQPWPQRRTGGTRALALGDARERGMSVKNGSKNGSKVAVAGGLTSKGVGGGHRPTSFQAFVSAEVTMAQSQNPLFAICNVMQISRERSAKDPRRARWRTPKALLTGIFHCGIPIYGLLPLCITGNTVTHTKARPWNTFRSFCAAWVLLCVPKKCQKGERGFVPAPAAMRWSHDNRSRQMAHRGFFIRFFLSRFHPWILARDSVFDFRQLTAWVMGSGLARTSEPSVENAPEKQSGSRHWRTMSDRHVVPEIHHLKVDIFCHPLAHPGRVERLIR